MCICIFIFLNFYICIYVSLIAKCNSCWNIKVLRGCSSQNFYLCISICVFVFMYLILCSFICICVFVRVKNLNSCREIKVSRGCSSQNLLSTNCQSSSLITEALTQSNGGGRWIDFGKESSFENKLSLLLLFEKDTNLKLPD